MVNFEYWLNRLSMATLLGAGILFIIEGAKYIDMKRQEPTKIPDKMYAAGVMTIVLGVISIVFALLHFMLEVGDKKVVKPT